MAPGCNLTDEKDVESDILDQRMSRAVRSSFLFSDKKNC